MPSDVITSVIRAVVEMMISLSVLNKVFEIMNATLPFSSQ